MADIDADEARALLAPEDERKARSVEARDFRRPRRLTGVQREELEALVAASLQTAQADLRALLGPEVRLETAGVGEVDARALFRADEHPCVLSFRVDGAEGWLAIELPLAVDCVERLLGTAPDGKQARSLSDLETGVLIELFAPLARRVATALQAECKEFAVQQRPHELWAAAARAAERDPHRLAIELAFERGAVAASLQLYLPGLPPPGPTGAAGGRAEPALGQRALRVPVALRARMSGSRVPLSQLLALEPGDVIPLDDRVGEPVLVLVGEKPFGTARLGTRRGKLAVRIERIDKEP